MKSDKDCLALFLDLALKAAIVAPREVGDLTVGSSRLVDQRHGGFMGFHDWLRKASLPKQVFGVRLWPHESSYVPKELLENRPYITPLAELNGFDVWFGPQQDCQRHMSGDQSFGLNRVLISADNGYAALVLDTHDLSPEELQSIESALKLEEANWI